MEEDLRKQFMQNYLVKTDYTNTPMQENGLYINYNQYQYIYVYIKLC